jgi:hypothetical protein
LPAFKALALVQAGQLNMVAAQLRQAQAVVEAPTTARRPRFFHRGRIDDAATVPAGPTCLGRARLHLFQNAPGKLLQERLALTQALEQRDGA